MTKRLAGKVAVITGASRGIGRALAIASRAEGMRLALSVIILTAKRIDAKISPG